MSSATQQSWAATTAGWASWLLDSYASSVSPLASEHEDSHPTSESLSHHPQSSLSSISTSSAYGPYVRTGRGGAGNFAWQTDLKPARSTSPVDLEGQRPPPTSLAERRKAAANLEHINTQKTMRLRQSSAQYVSTGRGGTGNYTLNTKDSLAPDDNLRPIQRSPSLPASFAPITPKTISPQGQYPVGQSGRGGAGNHAAAAEANGRILSAKEQKERRAAEERREQIIEEVDGLLQPPPGAWLGGKRRKSELMYDEED